LQLLQCLACLGQPFSRALRGVAGGVFSGLGIGEPGIGFLPVGLGRFDQAVEQRAGMGALGCVAEQPAFQLLQDRLAFLLPDFPAHGVWDG